MESHQCQCPVNGCGKSFKNPWALKVHFFRSHKELGSIDTYRPSTNSTSLAVAPSATKPLIQKIIEILRDSPDHKITTAGLVQKLAESGITSPSRDAMNQRISTALRANPKSGVVKPGRGMFQLKEQWQQKPDNNVVVERTVALDDLSDLPAEIRLRIKEIECQRYKNQLTANHEIFAGLTRLLALSVMSQE